MKEQANLSEETNLSEDAILNFMEARLELLKSKYSEIKQFRPEPVGSAISECCIPQFQGVQTSSVYDVQVRS